MINIENAVRPYSQHNEQAVVARLLGHLRPLRKFCVDIAANDGVSMSNTLAVYLQGWSGLAVEADPLMFGFLAKNYGALTNIGLARCFVTPHNVLPLLQTFGTPRDFGYLSLDIDGYDYFVLEQILTSYRPWLICAEINELIPPPLKFTVKFDPTFTYNKDNFQGVSISKLMELADRHNYDLIEMEFNNAFLIAREVNTLPVASAAQAWKAGYFDRPDRNQIFYWNTKFEALYQLPPAQQLEFLHNLFAQYAGKYELYL